MIYNLVPVEIGCGDITIWNDMPGRKLEDVNEAFSRAISKAKEVDD